MLTRAVADDMNGAGDPAPILPRAGRQGVAICADLTVALPAGRLPSPPGLAAAEPDLAQIIHAMMPEQVADRRATFNLT